MKIAIPTVDGLTINQQFSPAWGYLVSTIRFGEVCEQEMRWNPEKDMLESEEKIYGMIGDCDKVIVREIGSDQRNFLQGQKIAVVQTDETIITRVLMQYMQTIVQKESDTCCCP